MENLTEAYRAKISELVRKNIDLREDIDMFIKSERRNATNTIMLEERLRVAATRIKAQDATIARLFDEKYSLELDLVIIKEKLETKCYR